MTSAPERAPASAQDRALTRALDLHRAGRLADAADAYRALVADNPDLLAAVHGLGLVAVDLGQAETAIPMLARCVAAAPQDVTYRCSLGLALLKTGRADAAAVALLPAANSAGDMYQPRLLLARALGQLGRWAEARDIMVDLSKMFGTEPDVWAWRGHCENERGDTKTSLESFKRAVTLKPTDAELQNNYGVALRAAGKLAEAAEAYRAAVTQAPNHATAHGNLGNVLGLLGDVQGAEFHLRRALVLDPGYLDGHYNLGVHLVRRDRPEEAIVHLRQVVAAQPDRTDVLTNLGVALVAVGETAEAETHYRRAIALKPGNGEAHYDLAWLLLLTGRWEEGWREYEWRWEMPSFSSVRRNFTAPLWDGTPMPDGTLLIHAEQGLGDGIQFVRYANVAQAMCKRLVVECPRPLVRLIKEAAAQGLIAGDIVAAGDPLPAFDAHAPFMTLPRLFETTPATVPASMPYLAATRPSDALTLPNRGRKRIGLVWAGSPHNKMDLQRSMPAERLLPLFDSTDADFVSLQVGPGAEQSIVFPQGRLIFSAHGHVRDFADTAAVVSQLDLVIGVDTAAIHLAGALGKPVWLALTYSADYRWLRTRGDTPWYPTIRLFRQQKRGDWPGVIAALQAALTNW